LAGPAGESGRTRQDSIRGRGEGLSVLRVTAHFYGGLAVLGKLVNPQLRIFEFMQSEFCGLAGISQ